MRTSPRRGTSLGEAVRLVSQLAVDTADYIAEHAEPYQGEAPSPEEIVAADHALKTLQAQLVDAQSQILVARARIATLRSSRAA
jgi:hypothetical protein